MLRIDNTTDGDRETFTIEGRLVGEWVDTLRRAVTGALERSAPVDLDLDGVRYADDAGAGLLGQLVQRGARVKKSSTFIAKLLEARES